MSTPDVTPTQGAAQPPSPTQRYQPDRADDLSVIVDGLQQRELVEPFLLLSAGYVALPFFVQQARLLLAPLLALAGFPLNKQEEQRALPQ